MNATTVGPFDFFAPGRLWALLLLPLLIALYIVGLHLSKRSGIRYTNTGVLAAVLPRQSQWRRHVSVAMALCSLVLIGGAWARPAGVEKVARERATIILILDNSMSMSAKDVSPDRLTAVRAAAQAFVDQLPLQYNVSVVSLNASPSSLGPPSTDRGMVTRMISMLQPTNGTAIGDAIGIGLATIAQAPTNGNNDTPAPALMILLSDGTNTTGSDPLEAARTAAGQKVPIYTIAFGTANGYVDLDGQRNNVAPDKVTLGQIAQITGGRAMDAASAAQLNNVYTTLRSEVGYDEVDKEVTARWALYALAFAVVAALGAVSMAARWP